MLTEIVTLPVRAARAVGGLPGRLAAIERSMSDMQHLLAIAVERLDTIEAHTEGMHRDTTGMHNQLDTIRADTEEMTGHTEGLGANTDRLVRIAKPLERMGRRRVAFRRREDEVAEDAAGG